MRINGRRLKPEEFTAFEKALEDVFSWNEFKDMLRRRLGWNVLDVSADESLFTKMIDRAENNEQTQELLKVAIEEKPHGSLLKAFAQQVGFSLPAGSSVDTSTSSPVGTSPQPPAESSESRLQRKVTTLGSTLKPAFWRARMEQRERQICRIVIQGWEEAYGTGFLLEADVVMTNYHVLKDVIDGPIPASRVFLYFDYKLKEDGTTLEEGSRHQLADDNWRLDHSEHSDLDKQSAEHCVDVDERRLDFVLLRLKKKAGDEYIDGVKRGWIVIPELEYDFPPNAPLLILHHPRGDTLTFDFDTRSILEINARKTRVRYTTNTESGSSGAPCFTVNWDLVAMHQSGEPDFTHSAKYNQGIPIATILHRLKRYGTDKYLGAGAGEKGSNPSLYSTSILPIQFEGPENMLYENTQRQLALLLCEQGLTTFSYSSSTPFKVTREILEHIDAKHLSSYLYPLLEGYKLIIHSLLEKAKGPFTGSADLLPIHLKMAFEQLDLVEDCLRKICILLQHAIPSLDTIIVTRFTVEADNIIGEKESLCHLLAEEKRKYDIKNTNSIKRNIASKFANFVKRLSEFLQALPKGQ